MPVGDRYFRRTFDVPADRKVKRARYLATADNQCKAFINGRDIGGRDNYRTVKDSDLTHDMKPGKNLLAVVGMNKGDEPNPAGIVGMLTDRVRPRRAAGDPHRRHSGRPRTRNRPAGTPTPISTTRTGSRPRSPARSAWSRGATSAPRKTAGCRPLAAQGIHTAAKQVRRATVSLLRPRPVGAVSQRPESRRPRPLARHDRVSEARALRDARRHRPDQERRERARRRSSATAATTRCGARSTPACPTTAFRSCCCNLHIEYDDGSVDEIVSDESWKLTADGPILANNEYDGEEYDARKEFAGWSEPGFDDSTWQAAELVDVPGGVVVGPDDRADPRHRNAAADRASPSRSPACSSSTWARTWSAGAGSRCSGPAGTEVTLRHAETLKPDGTLYLANIRGAKVTDVYTLKGGGTEIWEPRFTYHGFRFVEVTGFPGKPTLDSLDGRVVHDDLEPVGEFACSNDAAQPNLQEHRLGRARQLPQRPHRLPAARRAAGLARRPLRRVARASRISSTSRPSTRSGCRTWRLAEGQRQRARRLPRPLADLFRQRHLADAAR